MRAMALRGGIDLGGTKIQAIVADDDNEVVGEARRPTPTSGGPGTLSPRWPRRWARRRPGRRSRRPSWRGSAGLARRRRDEAGTIAQAGNLPNWQAAVPVAKLLGDALGTKVAIGNDVSVATKAEFTLGAGKPYASVLGVFWGTGVGAG